MLRVWRCKSLFALSMHGSCAVTCGLSVQRQSTQNTAIQNILTQNTPIQTSPALNSPALNSPAPNSPSGKRRRGTAEPANRCHRCSCAAPTVESAGAAFACRALQTGMRRGLWRRTSSSAAESRNSMHRACASAQSVLTSAYIESKCGCGPASSWTCCNLAFT